MSGLNKKSQLEREPFSYRVITDAKVFIYKENRLLIMLRNDKAEEFITKIGKLKGLKAQKYMAKLVDELGPGL